MKTSAMLVWVLVGLSACASSPRGRGASHERHPPRATTPRTRSPPQQLALLLRALKQAPEDPLGQRNRSLIKRVQQVAGGLVLLEAGGKRWSAAYVTICQKLGGPHRWRCPNSLWGSADDTIHLTEVGRTRPPISWAASARARLVDHRGRPASGLLRLAVGSPAEMHKRGYAAARSLPHRGGSVRLTVPTVNGPRLVFAVFADPSGLFRKHVWIVK